MLSRRAAKVSVSQSKENKCDFCRLVNCLYSYVMSGCRSGAGSLFHSRAAGDWKQRSPNRVDIRVIVSVGTSKEWRWRRPAAVTSCQTLAR